MKNLLSAIVAVLLILSAAGQENHSFNLLQDFAGVPDIFEGYNKSTGGGDFNYHSLRADNSPALLTRCTTGNMAIEWETAPLPVNFQGDEAGFIWLASNDITTKKLHFDFLVDGKKQFTIPASAEKNWKLSNNQGFSIEFLCFESDQHGDTHGYMKLIVPKGYFFPGKSMSLSLIGEKAEDDTWMIVYRFNDAFAFLRNSLLRNSQVEILARETNKNLIVNIKAPLIFSAENIKYSSGKRTGELQMKSSGQVSEGEFYLPSGSEKLPFMISWKNGLLAYCPSMVSSGAFRSVDNKSVVETVVGSTDNEFRIKSVISFKPDLVESLMKIKNPTVKGGTIYLMNSSHQDIAWMDDVEKCIIERDTMLLTPLIRKALVDPAYRFDVEDALMLREYTGRHPEAKPVIKKLLADGKISCGSSYMQPYEEMYSGESLVRQFYLGSKWLSDEFGYKANTYWNMDVPGRTLQMPQILFKSGTKYVAMSRFEKGMYRWFSPDGSSVLAYSPGHYADAFRSLQRNFAESAQFISAESAEWIRYFGQKNVYPVIPLLSDWDMSPAKDYTTLLQNWNNGFSFIDPDGKVSHSSFPKIKIALTPEFLENFEKKAININDIQGERPAVWLYIHGPSHHKAIKVSREGDILITMAEKFATIDAMIKGTFVQYPEKQLNEVWEAKIYPDHGWGGKNGQITDDLFWQKFEFARTKAREILQNSLIGIASEINVDMNKGMPVVVFNSLSWERNCPVSFYWNFSPQLSKKIMIRDAGGNPVPCQVRTVSSYSDGSPKNAGILFIAEGVPSVGYKTFYISNGAESLNNVYSGFTGNFENRFYRIRFGRGGLEGIFDKELGKELVNPEKFLAGEVFTLRSVGNGAGEFSQIQQPDMEGFDRISWHARDWEQTASGPVYYEWKTRSAIRHAMVELAVRVFQEIKRIDFEIELLNWEGVLYREFRMAMPVNVPQGKVAYEVPFGAVEVGKSELSGAAGERYTLPCDQFHPRGIENWIGAGDPNVWVTLSSSVAVADYIGPGDIKVDYPILQPVLLASRKSCHHLGNEYLQTGNHSFSFSLTSHSGGWQGGFRHGREANENLQAVVNTKKSNQATLPESASFFSLNKLNFYISTIKKAEDTNSVIIRGVEWKGESSELQLNCFKPFNRAFSVNLTEEPQGDLGVDSNSIKIGIKPFSIETIRGISQIEDP